MPRGREGRVLATVLFTDVVGSTDLAVEMGDRRWRTLLSRHHEIVRRELKRFGGREIDTAGDGFFAIFDAPANAVRCAHACAEGVRELGAEIRAGLHTGEVELEGKRARGVAVHLGARVMGKAGAGEVITTGTVHDVVAGSGLGFEDRGVHDLKGVPGEWRLWRLSNVDGELVTPPLERSDAEARRATIQAANARRRPALLASAVGAIAIAGLVVLLLTAGRGDPAGGGSPTSGGGSPASPTPSGPVPGDVVELDPDTGTVLAHAPGVVPSSTKGISIARGEGGIWLSSKEDTTLAKLDQETGSLAGEYPIGFAGQGVHVEGPYVWVTSENKLLRVSPATGDTEAALVVESTAELPTAAGDGSVWVFADGEIVRVDAATSDVVGRFRAEFDVTGLAFGEGSLWAIDKLASELVQINPRNGKVGIRAALPGNLDALVVGEGYAWILDETAGTITPVDVRTGEPRAPLRVGEQPAGMALGLESLWVGDVIGSEIWRIDPLSLQTERIQAPAPVAAIVVDEGDRALWLALSGERSALEF
ncbi:MAG TPA: adenylate/guanylate cyclase domain-containing protein [Actinomycetota bacterium]